MELLFSPRERAERIIAGGRIVLAATSLAALWRDPTEPANYAAIAYALLAAYLLYAVAVAALVWRWRGVSHLQGVLSHCFDLAFFSAFMFFTSGPASPFIAYFVFSLICATLRWQWRGTMWTAFAALAVYALLGYYFAAVISDPAFEANRFVIRGVYMAVVAFLLGQLGQHEQRTRSELMTLASWSTRPAGSVEEVVAHALTDASRIHGAERTAIAWRRPGLAPQLGMRVEGALEWLPADEARAEWTAPRLESASVLEPATGEGREELLVREGEELRRVPGRAVPQSLRRRLGDGVILSAPWAGELSAGRLYVAGVAEATSDDLLLVELAATLVGARIDTQALFDRRREAAAAEERLRLSRDLHDGVLQSLTAIGLRVAAARRLLGDDAAGAEQGLAELQRLLADEQRDLRFVIRDLEPPPGGATEPDLAARLAELVRRVEREWQLEVKLEADELDDGLAEVVERDLYLLTREALVNAARHGGAKRVHIEVRRPRPDRARLIVEDDGRGFPFEGRFDLAALAERRIGPRSLRERIADRGGTLWLETGARGSRLEMEIPA